MESVDLPVQPPIEPMLAKATAKVPDESGVWSYEPKWDGFRALMFRDGADVVLQSRNGKDLGRYFPELLVALRDEVAGRCVLDGEVVVGAGIPQEVELIAVPETEFSYAYINGVPVLVNADRSIVRIVR